jgi:hypothetical protein
MGLDLTKKNTEFIVDEYGMMLERGPSWGPLDSYDLDDSIGTTGDAYMTYGNKIFIEAIKKCFVEVTESGKTYIQGYRHPSYINQPGYYNDMSRDHHIYALTAMKYAGETEYLKKLSKGLRWKISEKFKMTPDMWLWMKGIAGNWFAMILFYILEIILILFYTAYDKFLYKLGNFGLDLPQDQYKGKTHEEKGKIKTFLCNIEYPMYAFYQVILMAYVSNKSIGRWLLRKTCTLLVDPRNYLLCLISGKKVSKEDVYSYKSMVGWRWTTHLNDMCDREVYIITNSKLLEANVLDVDIIRKFYTEIYEKN